jgi:monomeric sarcosine oxidase
MKAGIVGAGIHGSSTALELAKRGHQVTIFEQFPLGHDLGSSHGASRIVRRAYPDPFYTSIMQEGYPLWHELERASGERLLYECGLLYFGDRDNPNINGVIASLESLGVTHEVLDRHNVRKVFADLILKDHECGIFTPEAGWVHADLAIQANLRLAHDKGAVIKQERVNNLEHLEENFDCVLLCQGAWATQFLPLPVLVTLQTFGYIVGEHYGPVWIEEGPQSLYGFPSEPWGSGLKTGVHFKDVPYDPENEFRDPVPEAVELIKDFAWRRFGHDVPRVKGSKGCLYTNTKNEDFLMGRVNKGFFVSACSGHGFKFGPWIGKAMADFAEGISKPEDYPRFFFAADG